MRLHPLCPQVAVQPRQRSPRSPPPHFPLTAHCLLLTVQGEPLPGGVGGVPPVLFFSFCCSHNTQRRTSCD